MYNSAMHIFNQRYEKLNDEQKKAVDQIDGPVLVIAGPGSGKTELLSLRVANIMRLTDTLPSSILCLTFTDSASINMRKRLAGLIGQDAYKVAIHTFHSFGSEIINKNPEYFYQGASFNPADELVQYKIIEQILREQKHSSIRCSFSPEQGFTYLKDIIRRIGELKKGGLDPEKFRQILEDNKLFLDKTAGYYQEFFREKISKKTIESIPDLISRMELAITDGKTVAPYKSMQNQMTESLRQAYQNAICGEKPDTKPITAWKKTHLKKNEKNEFVPAETKNTAKNFELCAIYEKYQNKLRQLGYFDYDDMLMDTVKAISEYPELQYNLQEKYLYVLVDEFQDTNAVQMKLLDLILEAEVNEGRPNILAVGDDDQSIYKFQGANLDNLINFHEKFRDPELIVLQKNYRSTQPVLDFVRKIIIKGDERLENKMPDKIKKDLVSANNSVKTGEIAEKEFHIGTEELVWIAENIKKQLDEGKPASEIAVIARKHKTLEYAAKVLDSFGIPVAYEKKTDLLAQKHIREIVILLRFINSLITKDQKEADEYLPDILSFPFWGIDRIDIWKISREAYNQWKQWLEIMLSGEEKIRNIAEFLINLGFAAKEKTAEEIIDLITGSSAEKRKTSLFEEQEFTSPYKEFYFSGKNFEYSKLEYLDYLECLQAFVKKIREYRGTETLMVGDVVEFVNLHETHKLGLHYKSQFSDEEQSVNLMTAHKAKGLEFDTVYLLHCQESDWINRMTDKLKFPANVPLAAESDNSEDTLRLFYVALTRAKSNLFICRHRYNEKGDEQMRLRFLEENPDAPKNKKENISLSEITQYRQNFVENNNLEKILEMEVTIPSHKMLSADENILLKNVVKNYQLSVTHFNNFLDITGSGPQHFLEQNLLRFPQMLAPVNAYGTAVHEALRDLQIYLKKKKTIPPMEYLTAQFQKSLGKKRLNKQDFQHFLERGNDHLRIYYNQRKNDFNPNDQTEFDFREQGVTIGQARITGKIDKIRYDNEHNLITVYDFKTGKPLKSWDGKADYEQIKAWKNRNQLIFYKILVENSREFKYRYKVKTGFLEFLYPENDEIKLLELDISDEETDRMKQLIRVVYNKIVNLDFPDISQYEKSMFGIGAFMEDLLLEKIPAASSLVLQWLHFFSYTLSFGNRFKVTHSVFAEKHFIMEIEQNRKHSDGHIQIKKDCNNGCSGNHYEFSVSHENHFIIMSGEKIMHHHASLFYPFFQIKPYRHPIKHIISDFYKNTRKNSLWNQIYPAL